MNGTTPNFTGVPGESTAQPSLGQFLGRLLTGLRPMTVLAGQPLPPRDGKPGQQAAAEDGVLLERTAHVRKPKETMLEFFARVGLGSAQIRSMDKGEITRFVKVAMDSAQDRETIDVKFFEPKAVPPRFVLTD
jgi:hypothetical protein